MSAHHHRSGLLRGVSWAKGFGPSRLATSGSMSISPVNKACHLAWAIVSVVANVSNTRQVNLLACQGCSSSRTAWPGVLRAAQCLLAGGGAGPITPSAPPGYGLGLGVVICHRTPFVGILASLLGLAMSQSRNVKGSWGGGRPGAGNTGKRTELHQALE